MLRVAIIGCGKIADDHLEQIERIQGCEVIGACDREPLMAQQLCERFKVPRSFTDVKEMLRECRPDVVHVTTPPQSHFSITAQCLEAGSNVYVEKPFTVTAKEAQALIDLATSRGRTLTVGHDLQFSHVSRRLRKLTQEGYLGGPPVHMESYYCYNLSDRTYAAALLANSQHWVRALPGKLLQNVISHGIARIAEFLTSSQPEVFVQGFVSPMLRSLGERDIIDELRVIVVEEQRTTAYFTFSSQMRPSLNLFRIFGPKNGLVLNQDHGSLVKISGDRFKSYVEKVAPQLLMAKQLISESARNMRLFLARDFHMKAGMRHLIETFYQTVRTGGPPPIPYREILLTQRIMDAIFEQLGGNDIGRRPPLTCHAAPEPNGQLVAGVAEETRLAGS
jgi:predicted dehydrogenase